MDGRGLVSRAGVGRAVAGLCAFLLLPAGSTPLTAQSPPVKSDQQILIELELAWNDALYRRDVVFVERVLADEFIATYDDGTQGDKERELALAAEFNQNVKSSFQNDFVVRVYGHTAVVWFTLRLLGIRDGRPASLTLRYTDTFVYRDGRWQCVSSHSTRVGSP